MFRLHWRWPRPLWPSCPNAPYRLRPNRRTPRPCQGPVPIPSLHPRSEIDWSKVKISPDALDEQVEYQANDSMRFSLSQKRIHLFQQAQVKYEDMSIQADYIAIDWDSTLMLAEGRKNFQGQLVGKPHFVKGTQDFTASRMRFNYRTYKGIIYDAITKQEGMNVVGSKAKYIGAGKDTTRTDVIYSSNAIFSTCDLEQPHFGIRSRKQKVIPDKVAVVGPSNLEIGGVPTPLWLPFAFIPLKIGAKTGLLFPSDYTYSEAYGFGLEGIGWYFPISDQWDLSLTTDVYMKGSVRLHANSNYRKRYRYNGNLSLSLAYLRTEVEGVGKFEPSAILRWSHNQDPRAHPYRTFGGSINIQTGNYQRRNETSASSVLQSSLSSNMTWRQRFDGPYDLSASFSHSQNTISRDISISFPNLSFQTQTIYPFKRKKPTGKQRWYETIQMRYTGEVRNQFTATDTTLFTRKTLDDAQYGVRHSISTSTSFNILRYFTVSPSANYKEVWYFKTLDKSFDPTPQVDTTIIWNDDSTDFLVQYDTVSYGQVIDMERFGLKPFRQYSTGVSINTKIFGTLLFKKGPLKGLRHVMTPSVGFSFSPDYTNPDWGYFKSVRTDLRTEEETTYSIFEKSLVSGFERPSFAGRQMALSYSISNLFEAKWQGRRDTVARKIPLFRSISVSGNYNFAADSLQWSPVRISGNTGLFNGISDFRFGITFDPYDRNPKTGARINTLYLDSRGKLLRLSDWDFTLSTNLTVGRVRDLIRGVNTDVRLANTDPHSPTNPYDEDIFDLFEDFSIAHIFAVRHGFQSGRDTTFISTHSISSRGSIQLTPNWRITVGNFGYDFTSKRVTYPDFGFYRDLHCWEMGFNWQPLFGTYSFYLRVKPGKLDFINIPYRKGIQDASRRFR
ncbi:MAG: organic solvent tolerance protein OstA [Saprospiraceae bacterium]|nr:MAG: organic solvent tolerance protein OstA [Saprospiraceae bacterium]